MQMAMEIKSHETFVSLKQILIHLYHIHVGDLSSFSWRSRRISVIFWLNFHKFV